MYAFAERLEPSDSQAQGIAQITDSVSKVNVSGTPEGVVSANPASLAHDRDSGDVYRKASGTGNTGWVLIASGSAVPTTFTADSGSATPAANNLNVLGGTGIDTTGAGDTLTIDVDDTVPTTFTGDSGVATPTSNNLNVFARTGGADAGATVDFTGSGDDLLLSVTDGNSNVTIGNASGNGSITGSLNVGVGAGTLQNLSSGSQNTAFGHQADNNVTTGVQNTAFGYTALSAVSTGNANAAFGDRALANCTGSSNIAIGHDCGLNLLGASGNTLIGDSAGTAYLTTESSNLLIRNVGVVSENNTIRIGTQGAGLLQQNRAFLAGVSGVTVSASEPVAVDSNGQLSGLGFGTSGQVLTSNGAGSSPTYQSVSNNITVTTPGAYPYTQLATDDLILVDTSSARTINLQSSPATGKKVIIKDNVGSAGTNNITITPDSGNIDGAASFVMNANYASITIVYNGTEWSIL